VIEAIARRPGLVFALLAAYFTLHILLRLALPASLELDEGQQIFLSQWLAAGYDSQPPFYNWVQYGVIRILGTSVLSLTLLKNAMLFASYVLVGLGALLLVRDRRVGAVAALSVLVLPQISFEAQRDLTHTVAVIFATCLFIYAFLRVLKAPGAGAYLLTGVAIGVGMISKYNFALLPGAVFLAVLAHPAFRARLFDMRLLLSAGAALVIVLPHAVWFIGNVEGATANTVQKMTGGAPDSFVAQIGLGVLSFAVSTAAFVGPMAILFWIACGRDFPRLLRAGNEWTRLILSTWGFAIAALATLVVVFGVTDLRDRWLIPLFLLLPLYLSLKLDAAGLDTGRALRRVLTVAAVVMVFVPLALGARTFAAGWTGDYQKLNVPYEAAAEALLPDAGRRPAAIIAGDVQLGGSLRLHRPDIAVAAPYYSQFAPDLAAGDEVLVIWRDRNGRTSVDIPGALAEFTRTLCLEPSSHAQNIELPYIHGRQGDRYAFSYAWMTKP
jgi:lipopolysaccharide core galacturonosyltransferase RgtB